MDTDYIVLGVRTPPHTKDKGEGYCSYLGNASLCIDEFLKTLKPHKYLNKKLIGDIYKDTGFYNNLEEVEKTTGIKLKYL